jgi:hypothetical protein
MPPGTLRAACAGGRVVKSSSVVIAVLLGLSGAAPVAAEPIQLAQRFAADVIPPYEVFTVIRSMGLRPLGRPHYRGRFYVVHAVDPRGEEVRVVVDAYAARVVSVRPLDRRAATDDPRVYRHYDSGPPPAAGPRVIERDPRYVPPAPVPPAGASDPRYSAPQAVPEDDDDYPADGPDEFDDDDEGRTGSLPSREAPRSIGTPRMAPATTAPATRSAVVTPPKAPLPRPRPQHLASAAPADNPEVSVPTAEAPAPEAKSESEKAAEAKTEVRPETKSEAKAEAPKSGVRIIEIKRPEPRI